ncbi:substrate-binding periplasmic protein [Chitinimonas lacunae]|uniref:Substrate-binding periplasmic protein n=1 Tax=Chitinimonas lacunae TaxID=1963018 RepID=A0ABV8MV70_9NEIS
MFRRTTTADRTMMNFCRLMCCLPFLCWSAATVAEEITLTNGEWPPYLSEQAPHYGIASRVVSEAFAQEGITVRYVFRPWRRAYLEAESGKYHGSVVWTFEKDRGEVFHFSDPIFEGRSVFFHLRTSTFDWKRFEDLLDYQIGGTVGYTYEFEKLPGIQVQRADTDSDNFRKLLAGRFDIFPSDIKVGYAVLRSGFPPEDVARITHHPRAYNVVSYHLILPKRHPESSRLLALFNRGLKKLRESPRAASYFDSFTTP